jgi:hypothetical protein
VRYVQVPELAPTQNILDVYEKLSRNSAVRRLLCSRQTTKNDDLPHGGR